MMKHAPPFPVVDESSDAKPQVFSSPADLVAVEIPPYEHVKPLDYEKEP